MKKKTIAFGLAGSMLMSSFAGAPVMAKESNGTIMWLSNLSSGIQYEAGVAYSEAICEALGYDFTVVYGDSYNDAAGNLTAVKNGMTSDVVGIMVSEDGGLLSIMEEFPDVYVAGYNTSMLSVYDGGENAAVLENDHFLGTICDGYANGADMGKQYAKAVIEKGYKKVSTVIFPSYAYPNQTEADTTFREEIAAYNESVSEDEQIEIIGDTLILEFQPLEESYFLEDGYDDLDCVVSFCSGLLFVYPTMVTAVVNGTCSPDTKLVTGGFDDNESTIADIGDEGMISYISFAPAEDPAYALVLLDNAISGNQYTDFTPDRTDSAEYTIDSKEDIENVMAKSMAGTGDVALAQMSVDEVLNLCVKNNPEATFADLKAAMVSEQLSVDELMNR